MKRIIIFLSVFLLFFTGCARQSLAEPPAPTPSASPVSSTATAPTPSPTPIPDAPDAENGVYTIAWISDTQHYSAKFPQTFCDMTQFLADNQARMNLGYVVHTGDLVHEYSDDAQWKVADTAMRTLDELPHGVLAGNHDFDNDNRNFDAYSAYFGEARYAQKAWYGASFADNRAHYDLITLGKTDYIFVYLSYLPDSECIAWANEALSRYPDRVGILCVHDYFQTDTTRSRDGEMLYQSVVLENPNLYMVLCGHRYTLYAEDAPLDDDGDGTIDRTVHQVMANYQAAGSFGGSGYMRFFQIDEANGKIRMLSYSPVLDDYTYFDTDAHCAEKYPSEAKYEAYEIDIPWKGTQS